MSTEATQEKRKADWLVENDGFANFLRQRGDSDRLIVLMFQDEYSEEDGDY